MNLRRMRTVHYNNLISSQIDASEENDCAAGSFL